MTPFDMYKKSISRLLEAVDEGLNLPREEWLWASFGQGVLLLAHILLLSPLHWLNVGWLSAALTAVQVALGFCVFIFWFAPITVLIFITLYTVGYAVESVVDHIKGEQ